MKHFLRIFLLLIFSVNISFAGQMEISADESLEWHRDQKLYYAKGNATAIDKDTTVTADELFAYYNEKEKGKLDIWKLEAKSKVLIENNGSKIFGENAEYNMKSGSFIVTGDKVSVVSPDYTMRASKKIEYFENSNKVVATGNVEIKSTDKTMYSDKAVAYLEDIDGKKQASEIFATGNVRIVTPTDIITSNKAHYDVKNKTASANENVVISRENSVITGNKADIDMNTGVAKMLSNGDKKRVKAVFLSEGE